MVSRAKGISGPNLKDNKTFDDTSYKGSDSPTVDSLCGLTLGAGPKDFFVPRGQYSRAFGKNSPNPGVHGYVDGMRMCVRSRKRFFAGFCWFFKAPAPYFSPLRTGLI